MQGSSRAAAAASREAFTGVLAAGADRSRLAEELFAVVGLLDGSATLRRAVADPSREGADKAQLAERLFAGKVSAETLVVLKGVFGQRWSSERDLTDTLEAYAVEAVIAEAEAEGRADQVEDELFRFERIVAADAGLRSALTDTQASDDRRTALVDVAAARQGRPGDPRARPPGRPRPARPPVRPDGRGLPRHGLEPPRAADGHRHLGRAALRRGPRAGSPRASPPSTAARSTSTPSWTPGSWAGSRSRSVTRSSTAPSSASSTRRAAPWVPEAPPTHQL